MWAWGIPFWIDELAIVIRIRKTIDYYKFFYKIFVSFYCVGATIVYTNNDGEMDPKLTMAYSLHRCQPFFPFLLLEKSITVTRGQLKEKRGWRAIDPINKIRIIQQSVSEIGNKFRDTFWHVV